MDSSVFTVLALGYSWNAVWRSGKEHSRIIWSCSWAADSLHFATGSRDQKVNLFKDHPKRQLGVFQVILWKWDENQREAQVSAQLKLAQAVTAVAVAPCSYIELVPLY